LAQLCAARRPPWCRRGSIDASQRRKRQEEAKTMMLLVRTTTTTMVPKRHANRQLLALW